MIVPQASFISKKDIFESLTILKPNDFFPLAYGINHQRNQYYLEALTPLSLWKAPVELFTAYIKTHFDLYYELTTRVLNRFDDVLTRMESLVFSNASTKIATTLLICAKSLGIEKNNDIIIPIPLTHRDIATLVGITRETTSLEMKKLEKKGYIFKSQGKIHLKNWKVLEQELLLYPQTDILIQSL
jgi:CRP-like cAMP-binding protein